MARLFTTGVRRADMLAKIGYPNGKLPTTLHKTFPDVPLTLGAETVTADVTIYPSRSPMLREARKPHRVYVVCPNCGNEVPAGRLHQHAGTNSCWRMKAELLMQETSDLYTASMR